MRVGLVTTVGLFTIGLFIGELAWSLPPTARPTLKAHSHTKSHELTLLQSIDPTKRHRYLVADDGEHILRMITKQHGEYVAYLGKTPVRVGDRIGNMTVTTITQHHVTLSNATHALTLSIVGTNHARSLPKPIKVGQ